MWEGPEDGGWGEEDRSSPLCSPELSLHRKPLTLQRAW